MEMPKTKTVDAYIAGFPKETQQVLEQIRTIMHKHIPKADEAISYGIPVIKLQGNYVIYFAGYKNHVSIYPAPRGHEDFKKVLSAYKGGKGTVQFPLNEPLPVTLISRIVKFRVKETLEAAKKKGVKKKS